MVITRTGYFREMPHGEMNDPSIHDHINSLDLNQCELRKALAYLNDAPVLVSCTGPVQDVIDAEEGVAGIPDCKTDGVWAWPGDYPYYVENYQASIDEPFLEHMRSSNWNPSFDLLTMDFDNLVFVNPDGRALG